MSNYSFYHQNPINKGIHFFCIPMIVLTSMNFLDEVKLYKFKDNIRKYISKNNLTLRDLIKLFYYYYYISDSLNTYIIMFFYLEFLEIISEKWKVYDKNWMKNSIKMFLFSWLMQFLGHAIEGRRPALLDSISSAFLEAPLFSIRYICN